MDSQNINKPPKIHVTSMRSDALKEIIDYRNPFLTYYAIPLLLLFLITMGCLSALYRIPQRYLVKEMVTLQQSNDELHAYTLGDTNATRDLKDHNAVEIVFQLKDRVIKFDGYWNAQKKCFTLDRTSSVGALAGMIGKPIRCTISFTGKGPTLLHQFAVDIARNMPFQ